MRRLKFMLKMLTIDNYIGTKCWAHGQVMIEYLMILMVVAIIIISFGRRLAPFLMPPPGEDCQQYPDAFICRFGDFRLMQTGFRYFRIPHE